MRILLIEDNPGDARLIQEMLKETSGNFTIDVVEKLGQALTLLESHEVDVILTDLGLPDSSGLETLAELRTQFSHLPIVITTSLDDEELGVRAVQLGAQDYLTKGSISGELLKRTLTYAIERKRLEERLRESQLEKDFLAGLISSASQPVGVGYPDGRLGFVNRAFEELIGYTAEELHSIKWTDLTPSEWSETEREKLAELHRTGLPVRYEKEYIRKDGGRVPIELLVHLMADSHGEPQYYYAFVTDITERKRAEEELRGRTADLESTNAQLRDSRRAALNMMEDSLAARRQAEAASVELQREVKERKRTEEKLRAGEEQFRLAIAGAPIPVIMHAEDGEVLQISRSWTELTGYTIKDIRTFDEWTSNAVYGEGADKVRDYLRNLFSSSSSSSSIDFAVRTTTGEIRNWSFSASAPGQLADGRRFIVGMALDITERKRAEEDVLKLSEDMAARNVELEGVNRELEAFIYSISHDLRAPLRSMGGFAKIMVDDYSGSLDQQGRDYLARIVKGSERMTRLIEDLLNLSRISKQETIKKDIDLSRIADSIISELRETDPGRSVHVKIAEGLAAFADLRLTEVVLSNILGNAWKFTSNKEDAVIEFGSIARDGGTVFYVKDNGAGFDQTYAEKMFWPFQRLHSDSEFKGTGMGLAIVERIIHRHGGKIWAEGEIGKGTTIYFSLG